MKGFQADSRQPQSSGMPGSIAFGNNTFHAFDHSLQYQPSFCSPFLIYSLLFSSSCFDGVTIPLFAYYVNRHYKLFHKNY